MLPAKAPFTLLPEWPLVLTCKIVAKGQPLLPNATREAYLPDRFHVMTIHARSKFGTQTSCGTVLRNPGTSGFRWSAAPCQVLFSISFLLLVILVALALNPLLSTCCVPWLRGTLWSCLTPKILDIQFFVYFSLISNPTPNTLILNPETILLLPVPPFECNGVTPSII